MPRVEIEVQEVERSGVIEATPVVSDATQDHYIEENNGDVTIVVSNVGGSDQTIEIEANPDLNNDGLTFDNLTLFIPYGETWHFGPFKKNTFKQDSDGRMHLNPSVSTDLLISAYKRAQAIN